MFSESSQSLTQPRWQVLRSLPRLVCTTLAIAGGIVDASLLRAANPPNIVMIVMDDMSWVGSSVQMDPNNPDSKSDYHRTPNLEALASQGMVFSNAYAAGPMCSATRAAILSGKSPAQMQVTDLRNAVHFVDGHFQNLYRGRPLAPPISRGDMPKETTDAEMIKQANPSYKTAFYGKWDWNPNGLAEGYDSFVTSQTQWVDLSVDPHGMYDITNRATNFMQQQVQANRPFFVALDHYAVKPGAPGYLADTYAEFEGVPLGTKHDDRAYAAMHREFDKTLGLVLDKINTLGVQDNTYVVFTSDHGAATDLPGSEIINAPLYGGKGSIWEGALRVPLIVKGPGIAPGSHSEVPVISMDFLPTFYDLAGGTGPLPAGVEGTSFKSVLINSGQLPPGQEALSRPYGPNGELFFHFPHYGPSTPGIGIPKPASAVRDGDYKLVRVYGENGAPDTNLLFNLAQNSLESNDPNSPLNLASQMSGKVAELGAKLDNWLEGVNASMALDVRNPITVTWKADTSWDPNAPFSTAAQWMSVNDVRSYRHERWETLSANPSVIPQQVAAASYQPGLAKKSLKFDGNDGIQHMYFQVSDNVSATIDTDNSVTVSTWVRFDDLNSEQLIFESGSNIQGLSLTMGDANGDGLKDELRFRVVGYPNKILTLTTEINKYVDPTRDFVQVSAVLGDNSNDRYLEVYVNGALAGRVNGLVGTANALNWDGLFQASLGGLSPTTWSLGYNTTPDTMGGASGAGDQPFTGGSLKGQIAEFEFRNHAMTAAQIRDRYNSYLDSVNAGVRTLAGQATVPSFRPSSVALNSAQSSSLLVMEERSDVLSNNLAVNALVTGPLAIGSANQNLTATLNAGTEFTSYLLHFDPASNNGSIAESVSGSINFAEKIIGVVFGQSLLSLSDPALGSVGNYGLETDRGLSFDGSDFLSVSADQHTLNFGISIPGDELLQFRVLTEKLTFLAADFNSDGYVDNDDLSIWQSSFGTNGGGDADGDGDTDGRDFLAWQREFQPSSGAVTNDSALAHWQQSYGVNAGGDFDGDGDTDGRDFFVWQREQGASVESFAAVPEPGSLLLAGWLSLSLALRRRVQ
jgi:arylsulfatase A-like enzyme